MILISACLAGVNCKYDGENNFNEKVWELVKKGEAILVCPEQLGGLTTPRLPAEVVIKDGKRCVIRKDGKDITSEYEKGAREVLRLAKKLNVEQAILKAKSPSCGCGTIYDGTFSHTKTKGNGITAQILIDNGIKVITEDEI